MMMRFIIFLQVFLQLQLFCNQIQAGGDLLKGLIGHWNFDSNSKDSSDSEHHGSNWSLYTADRFGNANKAFLGNGKSGNISVRDQESLDLHDALTLSAWIKPHSYQDKHGNGGIIFAKWYTGDTPRTSLDNGEYYLSLTVDGRLKFFFADYDDPDLDPAWDQLITKKIVPMSKWSHVAVTFLEGEAILFINGKQVGSKQSKITTLTSQEYRNDDLHIGGLRPNRYLFHGAIDDARLYNRALAKKEIFSLYQYKPVIKNSGRKTID